MENGRCHFEYTMGDTRINNFFNFFAFLSGRFNVKRDKWKDGNLEVYYDPGYEFDLDKMMESAKAGLDYYERKRASGRSSSRKYRVLESPRYRGRVIIPEYRPFFGEHRIYRAAEEKRPAVFCECARTGAPMVGSPVDRKHDPRLELDVRNAGGLFRAEGGEKVRRRKHQEIF
jgi:hypothetical protein